MKRAFFQLRYKKDTKSCRTLGASFTFWRMCRSRNILCTDRSHWFLIVFFTFQTIRRRMQTFFAVKKREKGDHKDLPATVLVSRVLCPLAWAATIYLCCALPHSSGFPPATIGTTAGRRGTCVPPKGVASDRVYMAFCVTVESVSSYLAFPSLPLARRSISVALSLRSPSADVIRYPSPMKPGLSSRYYLSAPYRAAAPHTCPLIIHRGGGICQADGGGFFAFFLLFCKKGGCIFC